MSFSFFLQFVTTANITGTIQLLHVDIHKNNVVINMLYMYICCIYKNHKCVLHYKWFFFGTIFFSFCHSLSLSLFTMLLPFFYIFDLNESTNTRIDDNFATLIQFSSDHSILKLKMKWNDPINSHEIMVWSLVCCRCRYIYKLSNHQRYSMPVLFISPVCVCLSVAAKCSDF